MYNLQNLVLFPLVESVQQLLIKQLACKDVNFLDGYVRIVKRSAASTCCGFEEHVNACKGMYS